MYLYGIILVVALYVIYMHCMVVTGREREARLRAAVISGWPDVVLSSRKRFPVDRENCGMPAATTFSFPFDKRSLPCLLCDLCAVTAIGKTQTRADRQGNYARTTEPAT